MASQSVYTILHQCLKEALVVPVVGMVNPPNFNHPNR